MYKSFKYVGTRSTRDTKTNVTSIFLIKVSSRRKIKYFHLPCNMMTHNIDIRIRE